MYYYRNHITGFYPQQAYRRNLFPPQRTPCAPGARRRRSRKRAGRARPRSRRAPRREERGKQARRGGSRPPGRREAQGRSRRGGAATSGAKRSSPEPGRRATRSRQPGRGPSRPGAAASGRSEGGGGPPGPERRGGRAPDRQGSKPGDWLPGAAVPGLSRQPQPDRSPSEGSAGPEPGKGGAAQCPPHRDAPSAARRNEPGAPRAQRAGEGPGEQYAGYRRKKGPLRPQFFVVVVANRPCDYLRCFLRCRFPRRLFGVGVPVRVPDVPLLCVEV